jgi:hypothetical protein
MFVFVLRMTQEQAARKPIVNAYYRYVGADQIVNDVQRQVPKDVLLVAGHVALITNVLTERRITVTFKF